MLIAGATSQSATVTPTTRAMTVDGDGGLEAGGDGRDQRHDEQEPQRHERRE
jgi:hypothetical protein